MRLRLSQRGSLWITVALLLLYLAARLAALSAFPPFVDEAFHINFSREVLALGPLAHAEEGRQFVVWLYALFGAPANAPLWTARAANLIVLTLGAAALVGAARLLGSRWSALFAALLLIFSPYHHFFERLALADPVSAAAVMLAVYFAARLRRRTALIDAIACGIALFFACGAKISALPYFAIPMLAVLTLRRTRAGLRWGIAALALGLVLTAAYLGILFWRGYNPFFYLETGRRAPFVEVFTGNIAQTFGTLSGYFTLPVALLLLLGIAFLLRRRRWFAPLCLLLPLAILWFSPRQDSRHLIAPVTLLLLGGALALGDLVRRARPLAWAALALLVVGGLLLLTPFALTLVNTPAALPLPADDRTEYMTSEGSGFGLAEVVAVLAEEQPTRVIGILANCLSLRDLAPFPVECPHLNPNGSDAQALTDLLDASRAPGVYAVVETLAYIPASVPGTVVSTINADRPTLTVYNLAP